MPFSDLVLSRRLERAEGNACVQFASSRRNLFPDSGSEWMECAGACVVFDGADSPVTQTFGLGVFEPLTAATLEAIEDFYAKRHAPVHHEVSPVAGVEALDLLCSRGYRPVEVSNVMYQEISEPEGEDPANLQVRRIGPTESRLWADVSARGWSFEHPELGDFIRQMGTVSSGAKDCVCFLGELNHQPAAAAALSIHQGVALFCGSATVPEFRRQGLQSALLRERMRFARKQGCDLAMMVAVPGSASHRNAERNGFRVAYTRTKWKLCL